jgi:hypothetical protein
MDFHEGQLKSIQGKNRRNINHYKMLWQNLKSSTEQQWHLMGFAFAIENVPRFSGASGFTPMRLFATTDVGANLVAAGNLLLRNFSFPLKS